MNCLCVMSTNAKAQPGRRTGGCASYHIATKGKDAIRQWLASMKMEPPKFTAANIIAEGDSVASHGSIAVARSRRAWGVNFVQIAEHRLHRGVKAVEVQTIKADLGRARRQRVVVRSQPADEIEHIGVTPHPGGETLEAAERIHCFGVGICNVGRAAHVAVDASGTNPLFVVTRCRTSPSSRPRAACLSSILYSVIGRCCFRRGVAEVRR